MGKDKYKEFKKLGEDIQYFGDDGNIKKGDVIKIKYKPRLRFLFQGAIEAPHFWGGKYTYLELEDIDHNKICGESLEEILILNKSYVLITKRALEKGKQKIPVGEPSKVTLDRIEFLRKLSDYSEMPSETL